MVLTEYTEKRSQIIDKLSVEDITKPYPIKTVWLHIMDSRTAKVGIFPSEHKHSFFEIHFLLDGEICYKTEKACYTLTKDHAIMFSPSTKHTFVDKSSYFLKFSLAFTTDEACALYNELSKLPEKEFSFANEIYEYINVILRETESESPFSPCIIQNKIFETIYGVTKALKLRLPCARSIQKETDSRFTVAKDFIECNISKPFCCEDVAYECGLSAKHLNRIFIKNTGQSLFAYITSARLKRAEQLLLSGAFSIKEISGMVGFENEYSFGNFFKKHTGMPPGYFRKNN